MVQITASSLRGMPSCWLRFFATTPAKNAPISSSCSDSPLRAAFRERQHHQRHRGVPDGFGAEDQHCFGDRANAAAIPAVRGRVHDLQQRGGRMRHLAGLSA